MGRWWFSVGEMNPRNRLLALVLVGTFSVSTSCVVLPETGQFYQLILANHREEPVVVSVNGVRRGANGDVVAACTEYFFWSTAAEPGVDLEVVVQDLRGVTLLTERRDLTSTAGGLARIQVNVPGRPTDSCPSVLPKITPTPLPWMKP